MENKGSLNREVLEVLSKDEIIDFTITKVDALTQKVAELEARLNQNSRNR
ncbi:hypothetical protein FACS1894200_10000 [Spirochaetia bacterium]|nr:hypothetical protein FACS1894200_10000 [Spirochaetia bacterium]